MTYQCKYCKKSFTRETTLTSHVCERKRRFQQEREIGVQWGLQAYIIFYETTQNSTRKTYEQFVDSSYYTAFVRFGRHCHSIHCPNFANFTRWLLKNNHKLDRWCQERYYSEWLFDYLRREPVQDALDRSMSMIIEYMAEHPEYRNGYRDYFRLVNENRVCYHITSGRLSAWVVYNCTSGQEFLERLNQDQVANVMTHIDPDYWRARFRDFPEDVKFTREVLSTAGL